MFLSQNAIIAILTAMKFLNITLYCSKTTWTKQTAVWDFWQCSWGLNSSGMLRFVGWQSDLDTANRLSRHISDQLPSYLM